jgi:hypothetical protein
MLLNCSKARLELQIINFYRRSQRVSGRAPKGGSDPFVCVVPDQTCKPMKTSDRKVRAGLEELIRLSQYGQ